MTSQDEELAALDRMVAVADRVKAILRESSAAWDAALGEYVGLVRGTRDPDDNDMLIMCDEIRTLFSVGDSRLGTGAHRLRTHRLVVRGRVPGAAPPEKSGLRMHRIPWERVEEELRMLPASGHGAPATGRWLRRPHGRVEIVGGPDEDPYGPERQAEEYVRALFPPQLHGAVKLADHVEIKMAMMMREAGATAHETLLVNERTCGQTEETWNLRFTCRKFLEFFLPKDATLTVKTKESAGSGDEYYGRGPR